MSEYIEGVGEVETPKSLKDRAVNFWYHYKWHSVISLILVLVLIVCSFQFCKKESYDIHVMYAGPYVVGKTASDGNEAEIVKVLSSLKKVTKYFDGDENVRVNFTNFLYMSAEEIENNDSDVDYAFISSDKKSLEAALEYSEYYLCFISPSVYEEYNEMGDIDMFMPLNEYSEYVSADAFYSDNAIKLSELPFKNLPGISALPDDTLVCIKTPSVLASKSKDHMECLSRAEETLINILKFDQEALN